MALLSNVRNTRTHPQDVVVVRMAAQGGIEERQRAMELLSILKARRGPGAPGTDRLADRAAAELEGLIGAVSARARSDSDALRALRRDCRAQLEMLQAGLARAIRVVGGDGGGRSRGSGADPARTPPRARPGPGVTCPPGRSPRWPGRGPGRPGPRPGRLPVVLVDPPDASPPSESGRADRLGPGSGPGWTGCQWEEDSAGPLPRLGSKPRLLVGGGEVEAVMAELQSAIACASMRIGRAAQAAGL